VYVDRRSCPTGTILTNYHCSPSWTLEMDMIGVFRDALEAGQADWEIQYLRNPTTQNTDFSLLYALHRGSVSGPQIQ